MLRKEGKKWVFEGSFGVKMVGDLDWCYFSGDFVGLCGYGVGRCGW